MVSKDKVLAKTKYNRFHDLMFHLIEPLPLVDSLEDSGDDVLALFNRYGPALDLSSYYLILLFKVNLMRPNKLL